MLSPFPAIFLIQEMRTRGFHPWRTDQPVPQPLSPTYDVNDNSGEVADFGGVSDTGVGLAGPGVAWLDLVDMVKWQVLAAADQDPHSQEQTSRHQQNAQLQYSQKR